MLLIVGQGILVAETLRSDLEVLQVEWNVGWINDTLGTLPSRILELPEYTGPGSWILCTGSQVSRPWSWVISFRLCHFTE